MTGPPKVAILDDYQGIALTSADWSSLDGRVAIDVFRDHVSDEDALVKRLDPYTIICAMRERTPFPRSVLERLPKLRFIASTGRRNRGIDIDYANEKGILVAGTGMGGQPVREHIWALILATMRQICVEDQNIKARNPQWQSTLPTGLSGKTLGVIGVGKLGSDTARIAKAFEMKVIGWSPHLTKEKAEAAGVEFIETKEELLRCSDIVSLHLVLAESTRHIIGRKELELLKPTAFLINTSRGPLVDEKALIEALKDRWFSGAGLDVYDVEPLPLDHPIRSLGNVTLSPHTAGLSDDNWKVFYGDTVENIAHFLDGNGPVRLLGSNR